jgi:hypothetical protein
MLPDWLLENKGDPQKEGVAIEAYLGDNLS